MDKQNVASHAASIKAHEYLAACDQLGFRYKINSFGEVVFREGKNWSAFDRLRTHMESPSSTVLKAVLLSLGRIDKPYQLPTGLMQYIDPITGLALFEIPISVGV